MIENAFYIALIAGQLVSVRKGADNEVIGKRRGTSNCVPLPTGERDFVSRLKI